MTNTWVCDYAWGRPDPAAIKAAGFVAVCRYLSHDMTGKTLTADEAGALHAAGLGVVLNFEDSAGRPLQGAGAGTADAQFANDLADQLGAPASCPIYYSCDTDPGPQPSLQLVAYYVAAAAVGRRPVGVYGGAVLVQFLLNRSIAQYGWTANASSWDHGVAPVGHMHQLYGHPAGTPTIAGVSPQAYDTSEVLNPNFGAWGGTQGEPDMTPDEHNILVAIGQRLQQIQGEAPGSPPALGAAQISAIATAVVAALPPLSGQGGGVVDVKVIATAVAAELAARLQA